MSILRIDGVIQTQLTIHSIFCWKPLLFESILDNRFPLDVTHADVTYIGKWGQEMMASEWSNKRQHSLPLDNR